MLSHQTFGNLACGSAQHDVGLAIWCIKLVQDDHLEEFGLHLAGTTAFAYELVQNV
jgi:hypothetical protein